MDQEELRPSTSTELDSERVEFVDDSELFPYHRAIQESHGQLDAFLEQTKAIDSANDDPNAVMTMRMVRRLDRVVSMTAAEYAYALGYPDVGDLLVVEMREHGKDVADTKRARAESLYPLADLKQFPFHLAVRESHGNVAKFQQLLVFTAADPHAVDAPVEARVVCEEERENRWSAVEYARHRGDVSIVQHLLLEKRVETTDLAITVLLRARKHAALRASAL